MNMSLQLSPQLRSTRRLALASGIFNSSSKDCQAGHHSMVLRSASFFALHSYPARVQLPSCALYCQMPRCLVNRPERSTPPTASSACGEVATAHWKSSPTGLGRALQAGKGGQQGKHVCTMSKHGASEQSETKVFSGGGCVPRQPQQHLNATSAAAVGCLQPSPPALPTHVPAAAACVGPELHRPTTARPRLQAAAVCMARRVAAAINATLAAAGGAVPHVDGWLAILLRAQCHGPQANATQLLGQRPLRLPLWRAAAVCKRRPGQNGAGRVPQPGMLSPRHIHGGAEVRPQCEY